MIRLYLETEKNTTPEYVFMDTLLRYLGLSQNVSIETVGGKDKLSMVKGTFLSNSLEKGTNLIVFDADDATNNGGYDVRKKELMGKIDGLDLHAKLFLFPNNKEDGCFEDLLLKIARKEKHKRFFDCFGDYEFCLGDDYHHPDLKGKVFTYISSMKGLTKNQRDSLGRGKWHFDNPEYWDLESPELSPLKDFLKENIK